MKYTLPCLLLAYLIFSLFACTPIPTATCTDQIHNGDETEIDCGGPTCSACPSCSDGIMNGSETDVDCGGPGCTACDSCVTCTSGFSSVDICLSNSGNSQAQMDTNVVAFENGGYSCS